MSFFYTLCLLSGVAGLVYEVAWTRLGVLLFGATAPAIATVLACFMGGLGLGAALGGRSADCSLDPQRRYGLVELFIGLWAVAFVLVQRRFPVGELDLSGPGGPLLRVLLAVLCVGPPTTAMGMTLPLLVRCAGAAALSPLYAANTAGAIIGTLATGFVLLEHLGVRGAQLAAAGLNLLAAGLALSLRRSTPAPAADEPATSPAAEAAPDRRLILLCAALLGLGAMALEVLLTRALDLLTFSTMYAFCAILALFLASIAAGSAAIAHPRLRRLPPRRLLGGALGLWTLWVLLSPLLLAVTAELLGGGLRKGMSYGLSLRLALAAGGVVLLPMLCSGAAFPLLCQLYLRGRGGVGRGVGRVYLANTVGGVLGSLLAGFVLLPRLGLGGALLGCAVLPLAALLVLGLGTGAAGRRSLLWLAPCLGVLVAHWRADVSLPRDLYRGELQPGWDIVSMADDPAVSLMIARQRDTPERMGLWLDGNYVAGTGGGHLLLAHLPMLRHGKAQRLLGACMGTGQTFGVMASYPIEHMDCVELSPAVVRGAETLFSPFNRGLFHNPHVQIHIGDVRRYVRAAAGRYDVVTAEPLQPWTRGTVSLYSQEYYRQVRRALRPGGIAVQWIPLYEVSREDMRGIVATFQSVFPDAELWLDAHDVILLGADQLPPLDAAALEPALQAPQVRKDLERLHIPDAVTLLSKRVLGAAAVRRYAASGRIITDADPYLELSAPRAIGRDTEREHLSDYAQGWDLDFGPGGAAVRQAAQAAQEALQAELIEQQRGTRETTRYLRALARWPRQGQVFARTAARVAQEGQTPQGIAAYQELLRLRPDYTRGWVNLGAALQAAGQDEAARLAFTHALDDADTRLLALLNLGSLAAKGKDLATAAARWQQAQRLAPSDPRPAALLRSLPAAAAAP